MTRKSNAEHQAKHREKIAINGLKEIRGLYVPKSWGVEQKKAIKDFIENMKGKA